MSEDTQAAGTPAEQILPQVSLGPHKVSRLIMGGNPTSGGVHMPRMFNYQIKRFYTPERVVQVLGDCEKNGISVWQTCLTRGFPTNLDIYRRHRELGGNMQYMAIAADMPASRGPVPENFSIESIAKAGAIAIAHWGSFTDRAWRAGKMDQVREYLKKVRDAGLVVGVSTHRPDVIDYVERGAKHGSDPIGLTAAAAFGFVYIHPFEDGNGRVHRWLIHHALAVGQVVPNDLVFPVSRAMLRRIDE